MLGKSHLVVASRRKGNHSEVSRLVSLEGLLIGSGVVVLAG